jgi:cobalamin biosynthesis protein CobT
MLNTNKQSNRKNEQLVDDPRELLLSLVDLGSLDVEDALLACVKEMSDAECKRVLSGISLPNCCDMEDEDMPSDSEDDATSDELSDDEFNKDTSAEEETSEDEDIKESDNSEDEENEEDEDIKESDNSEDEENEEDEDVEAELEARIRRLERTLRFESMNRNRIRKSFRRTLH